MASQTEHVTSTAPASTKGTFQSTATKSPMTTGGSMLPPPSFWQRALRRNNVRIYLIATAVLLNLAILGVGYWLFFSGKTVEPSKDRRMDTILYLDNTVLWDKLRPILVLEDGRKKPLGVAASTAMKSITGRSKFEGQDALPVFFSWWMLYEHHPSNVRMDDPLVIGKLRKELKTDWENYPFILCEFQPLRKRLYEEHLEKYGEEETHKVMPPEEWKHGKFVPPAVLRKSIELEDVIRRARFDKQGGKVAPLEKIEQEASDVSSRVDQYDKIRKGQYLHLVALDAHSDNWFNLFQLRGFLQPIISPTKNQLDSDTTVPLAWGDLLTHWRKKFPETYTDPAKKHFEDKRARLYDFQQFPEAETTRLVEGFDRVKAAYRSKDASAFEKEALGFFQARDEVSEKLRSNSISAYDRELATRELTYVRIDPFKWAWIVSLLATFLLGASLFVRSRAEQLGRVFYCGGLATQFIALAIAVYGFWCRVTISGRPPISNMYESVIWVAFMTSIFGLILELIYRRGFIALAAGLVSTLGFVWASQLPVTMGSSIQPLQPVLRSNYWLTVHVVTIVSSYAAFALAWGLGNLNIGLILFSPQNKSLIKTLSAFSYRAIQIGVIMLFFGTMLGGFWAAESWGRFWGWDAKEVWALIALLFYIIPLHARYVGWVKDFGLAVCSVVCFVGVFLAWYGVNFIFGTGMHAYGGAGAGNNWVYYWAGLISLSLVVHASIRYLDRKDRIVLD